MLPLRNVDGIPAVDLRDRQAQIPEADFVAYADFGSADQSHCPQPFAP